MGNNSIEKHYEKNGLYEDIIRKLKDKGINTDDVKRSDIAGVDEFHVRGAAVSRELANSIDINGKNVLDVGCGLGGPSRLLADEYNCKVTGIDMCEEYIKTATELSTLLGLDNKTTYMLGDATNLPFEDESFDVVWTQHVQMNIADKHGFYSEIKRVLAKDGYLVYYDVFGSNNITFPLPWASAPEHSFVTKKESLNEILGELRLLEVQTINQTEAGLHFFEKIKELTKQPARLKMGLNVLMGNKAPMQIQNLHHHLIAGDLELWSGIVKK